MYPTNEQAKQILNAEQIEDAIAQGENWAELEAGCWKDGHDEYSSNPQSTMPDWTMGEWAGSYPSDDETIRIAYEVVLDNAARDRWNAIREA